MHVLVVIGVVLVTLVSPQAGSSDPTSVTCGAVVSLDAVAATCKTDQEKITQTIASAPSGEVYKTQIRCLSGGTEAVCNNPQTCDSPPGSVRYDVLRSTDNGVTYTKVSEACLTNPPDEEDQVDVLTTADVERAFKEIAWPASGLEIQPPGGRTLVNLATNFFTTNTAPSTQVVTLLAQQVEIEATPTSWTWVHGDGTSQTTTDPGAAYPALDVTHTYTDAGVSVAPQVDTTYSGRYRVNGGAWVAIPSTVTIVGAPGELAVVPAEPQLVAAE